MSEVIDFLERMGRDARLRHAASEDFESALSMANITGETRSALLTAHRGKLETLLAADKNTCCAIFPVDGDDPPIE